MADIVFPDVAATRSRDLKKTKFAWTDLKVVHEFGKDSAYKGHAVAYIDHPDDLALLGKTMGHCAGTHFIWACEEKIWYFFTVVTTDNMQPHTTLHAKQLKWVGVAHPRDTAVRPYAGEGRNQNCGDCKGYGGIHVNGMPAYFGDRDTVTCKTCKGRGWYVPEVPKDKGVLVPRPRASSGGYATYADVCAAFESVGRKYEAGKYAPLDFDSRTYEIPKNYKEQLANFDGIYGGQLIKQKPAGVDDNTWAAYTKAVQGLKGEFDKVAGAVQIVGRTFKFDGKELYTLSFSARGQDYGGTQYRGMMHEFFIECAKKPRKESDGK